MRRQMLDEAPQPQRAAAAPPRDRDDSPRTAETESGLGRRFEALVGDVDALRAEGSSYTLMAEVANELQNLRQQMKDERDRP